MFLTKLWVMLVCFCPTRRLSNDCVLVHQNALYEAMGTRLQSFLTVSLAVLASVIVSYAINDSAERTSEPQHQELRRSPQDVLGSAEATGNGTDLSDHSAQQLVLEALTAPQGQRTANRDETNVPSAEPEPFDIERQMELERTEMDRLDSSVLSGAQSPEAASLLREQLRDAFETSAMGEVTFDVECSARLCAVRSLAVENEQFEQLRTQLASSRTGIQQEFIVYGHINDSEPGTIDARIYIAQNGSSIGRMIEGI